MVSILVISLIFLSTFLSLWQALYWILLSKTQEFLSEKFCQVPKPNGAHKNKWNGPGYMAKLKGIIIYPYFVKYVVCLIDDYKTNFNSTVIWSRFSHVSVFFVLMICLSHGQVLSKVYMSELYFYQSWTIIVTLYKYSDSFLAAIILISIMFIIIIIMHGVI